MREINICDNHDEALTIWREKGVKNAVVIHVDAHIDFTAPNECFYITIANYLNYAYEEGIIKTLVWVIPDISFNDDDIMNSIIEEISGFFYLKSKSKESLNFHLIDNKNMMLYITTIQYVGMLDLIKNEKNILLDIDCDYFMNPQIKYTYSYFLLKNCWIKCNYFCKKIYYIFERCNIVTISNSIVGGYTPLLFSYLSLQIKELLLNKKDLYVQLDKVVKIMEDCPSKALHDLLAMNNDEDKAYQLLAITYCHMFLENYEEARKNYEKLFSRRKRYERYFLPVHGLIKEGFYIKAEKLIDKWLTIAPYSQVAICYKVRVELEKPRINSKKVKEMLGLVTDAETYYEKSYLFMLFYFKIEQYKQTIVSGLSVIDYLLNNNSPEWLDQISSFERYKNHGIIIAKIYNYISVSYMKLGEKKEAIRYARLSKLMGFSEKTVGSNYVIQK